MINRLLLALTIICCVSTGNTWAGNYAVGSLWNISKVPLMNLYGVRGYVVFSPYTIYQAGNGLAYQTITNGSAFGPESLVHYHTNNHLGFKVYRWVPAGHTWYDAINKTTGTGSDFLPNTPLISNGDGTIDADFSKYVVDVAIGAETKKAIYFTNMSCFEEKAGTLTGTWHSWVTIKNQVTTNTDCKWYYKWDGTLLDNATPDFNGHNQWGGSLEVFNATSTPYSTTGTNSIGYHLLEHIGPAGQWYPDNAYIKSFRGTDTSFTYVCPSGESLCVPSGNSGFVIYNPEASPGNWLAKVP